MYCTCSNKNNYEVISLCDIKKFTDKNGPFNNKPWVQISIADILILDCTKLSIEKIEKIYINISITSTKVIETPISPNANSEGLILTGKKLLIDGFICSKIVYTSLTKEQSVYTSNFTVPFCTYIVIEANADPFNDKYCIRTCIEDVFLSLVDCKTIFQNVTLFLLAENLSFDCPMPQFPKRDCTISSNHNPNPVNLPNDIILNDLANTPVVIINFDSSNNKIIVNSTGKTTDPSGTSKYFKLTLYASDGTTEKINAIIGGNESGINFSNRLSNTNFQYDDVVKLQYQTSTKVIITNFPTSATPTYTPKGSEESFRITRNGLTPSTPSTHLANSIIFTDILSKKEVARIDFDKVTKKLVVTSTIITATNTYPITDGITNAPSQAVFLLRLRDSNNNTVKASSVINGNETASNFQTELNSKDFEFDDILEIYSLKEPSTTITNFPSRGTISPLTGDNIGDGIRAFLKITPSGLQKYTLKTEPSYMKLPNDIVIRGTDNTIVGSIQFDTTHKMFYFIGFDPSTTSPIDYTADVNISNKTLAILTKASLSGKVSIPLWVQRLNFLKFDYNNGIRFDKLTLPPSSDLIAITNFLSVGHTENVKLGARYIITDKGLTEFYSPPPQPDNTNQKIFIGKSQLVATVEIDTTNKVLLANSTGYWFDPLFSSTAVFLLKLRDSTQNIKFSAFIEANKSPTPFITALNNKNFILGDILEIRAYFENDNSIANFPSVGQSHIIGNGLLTGDDIHELFTITDQGLQRYTPPPNFSIPNIPSEIIIKRPDGTVFLTISFDSESKVFLVSNTDNNPYSNSSQIFRVITFVHAFGGTQSILNSDDDAFIFAQNIRLKLFQYNDVLVLKYTDTSRQFINITNIQGSTYTPTSNEEVFDIKATGLEKR